MWMDERRRDVGVIFTKISSAPPPFFFLSSSSPPHSSFPHYYRLPSHTSSWPSHFYQLIPSCHSTSPCPPPFPLSSSLILLSSFPCPAPCTKILWPSQGSIVTLLVLLLVAMQVCCLQFFFPPFSHDIYLVAPTTCSKHLDNKTR